MRERPKEVRTRKTFFIHCCCCVRLSLGNILICREKFYCFLKIAYRFVCTEGRESAKSDNEGVLHKEQQREETKPPQQHNFFIMEFTSFFVEEDGKFISHSACTHTHTEPDMRKSL
jgi:hypothetical protein